MAPRFFVDVPLSEGHVFDLPNAAVHHVHARRLLAGSPVVVFNGQGGEWRATLGHVGRDEAQVRVGAFESVDRELTWRVTLAVSMPANERMDTLVEKATELGASVIQPLVSERTVLRLAGERAVRKREHWQAIAVSACQQCGRTRIPRIEPVRSYDEWLGAQPDGALELRWLCTLRGARPLGERLVDQQPANLIVLSGPEGGFTAAEEIQALERGFVGVNLGPRILRSDTAPLAVLSAVGCNASV